MQASLCKLILATLLLGVASPLFALDFYPSSQFLGTNFLRQTNAENALAAIGGGVSQTNYPYTAITNAPWLLTNYWTSGSNDLQIQINANTDSLQYKTTTNQVQGILIASNFLQSIPVAATNQFLISIPVDATNQFALTNDTTWFAPRKIALTNGQDGVRLGNIGWTNGVGYASGNFDLRPSGGGAVYSGNGSSDFIGASVFVGNVGDRGGYSALSLYGNNTKQIRFFSVNQTSPDLVLTNGNVFSKSNLTVCATVAPPPFLFANQGTLWNSNKVLYWVTNTKTNLISDGN